MRRALRIGRGVAIALVALVAAAVGIVIAVIVNDSLLARVLPRAARWAGYELRVGRVEHRLGKSLALENLVLSVKDQPPLLEARDVRVDYSLAMLVHGVVELSTVTIDEPSVHLVRLEDGTLAGFASKPASPSPAVAKPLLPLPVRFGHVELRHGELDFDDRAAKKRYGAGGVGLSLEGGPDPAHADLGLDVARATLDTQSLGPVTLRGAVDGDRVSLASLDVRDGRGSVTLSGSYDLAKSSVDARADVAALALAPILAAFGVTAELPDPIDGTIRASGALDGELTASASLSGPYREAPLECTLDARGSIRDVRSLSAAVRWSGAQATADGRLDLAGAGSDLAVRLDADSLDPLARIPPLADLRGRAAHLSARVTGPLATPHVEIRDSSVETLTYATTSVTKLRLDGSVEAPAGALAATVAFDQLATGDTRLGAGHVDASGTLAAPVLHVEIGPELRADARYDRQASHVEVHAHGPELPLDPFLALAGLRGASGSATNLVADVEGDPSNLASLRGQARIEKLSLRSGGSRIESSRPIALELADGLANVDAELRVGAGTIAISGSVHTAERTLDAKLDTDLDLAALSGFTRPFVPDLTKLSGHVTAHGSATGAFAKLVLDARATATGVAIERGAGDLPASERPSAAIGKIEASVSGPLDGLNGQVDVTSGSASVSGRSIASLEAHVTSRAGNFELSRLAAVADGVPIEARGRLTRDRTLEGVTVEVRATPLQHVPELADSGVTGNLTLTATASGPMAEPVMHATASVPDLAYRARSLGALALDAGLEHDRITADARLPQNGSAKGTAELSGKRSFDVELDLPGLDLDPVFATLASRLPPALADARGKVVAHGRVTGQLSDLAALEGTLTLSTLHLEAAGKQVDLAHPTDARLGSGHVDVPELALELGDGGRLRAEAHGTRDALDGALTLDLDPQWFNPFLQGTELGSGKIDASVRFQWAHQAFTADGPIHVAVSSVSVRDFPEEISDVQGSLAFHTKSVTLEQLAAKVGDGEIHATGAADLESQSLERLAVDFSELPYRVPKTLRLLASGHLEGHGSRQGSEVSGEVRIDDALYDRDVELFAGLVKPLSGAATLHSSNHTSAEMLDRIRLGIKVTGPETIVIRNNVAHATMSADLSVSGTAARPQLLGEVDVVEGKLTFFDRDFEVTHGSATFEDPVRIDPDIDFESTSIVDHAGEDVSVRLALDGTVSKGLALTLDSEPPFPQDDLVFLLATGKTRDEALAGGGTGAGVTGLSLSAIDLFGGKLAKQHLGVEEFSLAQGDEGGTRVTVGKRISDRMQVRVVDQMGGETGSDVALNVEYQITDQVIAVVEPQSTGAVGAELRLRFSFR